MKIDVCRKRRLIEIWLTGAEGSRPGLSELCAGYRRVGYRVAVFRSGGGELAELTSGLLAHNRDILEMPEKGSCCPAPPAGDTIS